MTTRSSPITALKKQADKIASVLKAAERGEKIDVQYARKIDEARSKPSFKAGIVMDDKALVIEMPWEVIRSASEAELSRYIVDQMQEANNPPMRQGETIDAYHRRIGLKR